MIERSIKNGIKMYQIKPRTDKNKRIINNSNKIIKAIELFKSMIINNEFIIPEEYIFKPNNNVYLDWMINKNGFEETAEEAKKYYMKGKNDNELKLIKDFITKINNGTINKNEAENVFRKLKQKVANYNLEHDFIKNLEKDLFGEEKYEESIAERVKTRRKNTQQTFAPSSPSTIDYSKATADYLKYMEEQEKGQKRFSDDYDSNGWSSGSGLKILTNKQMLNRLPILLAQIQAGNNSIKLKKEIRQILYSYIGQKY